MHRCIHCGRFINPEAGCNKCMEAMMLVLTGLVYLAVVSEIVSNA